MSLQNIVIEMGNATPRVRRMRPAPVEAPLDGLRRLAEQRGLSANAFAGRDDEADALRDLLASTPVDTGETWEGGEVVTTIRLSAALDGLKPAEQRRIWVREVETCWREASHGSPTWVRCNRAGVQRLLKSHFGLEDDDAN